MIHDNHTQRILRAVSSDTESVIVLGRVKYKKATILPSGDPEFYMKSTALQCNATLFQIHTPLKDLVETQEIELSVFAFRPLPGDLSIPSATPYEGVQVIVFKEDVPATITSLFEQASERVLGFRVFSAKQTFMSDAEPAKTTEPRPEPPRMRADFAMLSSRVLLAATTRDRLETFVRDYVHNAGDAARFSVPKDLRGPSVDIYCVRKNQGKSIVVTYEDARQLIAIRENGLTRDSEKQVQGILSAMFTGRAERREKAPDTVDYLLVEKDGFSWLGVMALLGIGLLL